MGITPELVAEGTEPERREQWPGKGSSVTEGAIREPPVVPPGWNRKSCRKVALMEWQNVGGAEMRPWALGPALSPEGGEEAWFVLGALMGLDLSERKPVAATSRCLLLGVGPGSLHVLHILNFPRPSW